MEPVIRGLGHALPATVRTNDDPIFDWLHAHPPPGIDLFKGYVDRRVLAPGEDIVTLACAAASDALAAAKVSAGEIDLVCGDVSIADYVTPNALAAVHRELKLPERAWVIAHNNEFSNFTSALAMAEAFVAARRARHALVVVASNWTRYLDYHTAQSISAGDGAAAVVVGARGGAGPHWRLVDHETITQTKYYGSMFMAASQAPPCGSVGDLPVAYTQAYFQITPEGQAAFKEFGATQPVVACQRLLQRHALEGRKVSLISHQASAVLMDAWAAAIKPGQYVSSLTELANMTAATIPVNLARFAGEIAHDHVVLLSIGADMHTVAALLHRT